MSIGPRLLTVDTRELKKLSRDLTRVKKSALPYAVRATLNSLAFEARGEYQREMGAKMKLRNKYTVGSVRVDKAGGLQVHTMKATMGTVADYMDEQEEGAVQAKEGKHGVPLPAAAPGARKNRGRVARAKQIRAINILPRVTGHRSRKIGAAFSMAARRGGKQFAFLKLRPGRQGIYEINPGRKRLGLRKVWDLSKGTITIPRNPMMKSAVQRANRLRDGIWREALLSQLKLHRALGY
jgi:hypothetical protein